MSRLDARSWPASWPLLILLSKPDIEAGSGFEGARPGGHIGKLAICATWPPGWNPALRAEVVHCWLAAPYFSLSYVKHVRKQVGRDCLALFFSLLDIYVTRP